MRLPLHSTPGHEPTGLLQPLWCWLTSRARSRGGQEELEETQNPCRKQLRQPGGPLSNGCEGRVAGSLFPEHGRDEEDPECLRPRPRPEATDFLLPDAGVREFPSSKNPRTSASQETFKVIPSNHIPAQESFHAIVQPLSEFPPGREAHYLTRQPLLPLTRQACLLGRPPSHLPSPNKNPSCPFASNSSVEPGH